MLLFSSTIQMGKYFLLFSLISGSISGFSQGFLWAKHIGGNGYDFSSFIVVDDDKNTYTVGSFEGEVDFDPGTATYTRTSAGESDIYISKSDPEGNFLWVKTIGGINDDSGVSLAVDSNGNVYYTGGFTGTVDFDPGVNAYPLSGLYSIVISKLDPSGNFVWAKNVGGSNFNYAYGLSLDASGNVYTTGHFEGGGDFDPGPETFILYSAAGYNAYVLKLDTDGNFVWAKSLGGPNNTETKSIIVDANGAVYTTGQFSYTVDFDPGEDRYELTSAGEADVFVCKWDSNGNFIWAKAVGGPGGDIGSSMVIDDDENVYLTGSFEGVGDFDPSSESFELVTNGYQDIFISKFTSSGDLVWAKGVGGSDTDGGSSIAVDPSGDIYVSGTFQALADMDPGEPIYTVLSKGEYDIFILKLDAFGNFIWCAPIGGYGTDHAVVTVDHVGAVYCTGFFNGSVDVAPGGVSANLISFGVYDIFMLKLDNATITGVENFTIESVEIYPNPLSTTIMIEVPQVSPGLPYRIIDTSGRVVQQGDLNSKITLVDCRDFPPGLYAVQVGLLNRKSIKILKL